MANKSIYYPLIKKGFQEVADTSSIESDIAQLQSDVSKLQGKKVTKCLDAADLSNVEDGEIFQWQGADTENPSKLLNGFFYKKTVVPTTQQVLKLYHNYPYIGGWYQNGVYYYQRSEETSLYMRSAVRNTDSKSIYWIGSSSPLVGTIITVGNDELTQTFVTIVSYAIVGGDVFYTDSAGDTWKIAGTVTGTPITFNYYTNSNNATIITTNTDYNYNVSFVKQYDNNYYVTRWTDYSDTGAQFDIIQNPEGATYTQTDNQPRTPGVTVADGVIKISLPVEFSGNITVHGSEVIVTTEQIQSENDFIKLRYNNPLALAAGETSGISVNNYDGNATDCILAVDKDGWARVGDSSGTLQKLATIEETPTNGALLKYNSTTKELESDTHIFVDLTKSFSVNNYFLPARITASGNYVNFTLFYPIPATATNINLQISKCVLLYNETQSSESTVVSYTLINNLGLAIDILLTTSRTPFTVCGVLIDFTLSFD